MKKLLAILITTSLLVGCTGLYKTVITITKVRDNAMHELAELRAKGLISNETDAKIDAADANYRRAAEVAAKSLETYKLTGDKGSYVASLSAVKSAVEAILDILTPLIGVEKGNHLKADLLVAQTL